MGLHTARPVCLSVFCLCLRPSCLSRQAGVLLKQDHSCGTGGEERRRSARENHRDKNRLRQSLHLFIFINLHSHPTTLILISLTSYFNSLVIYCLSSTDSKWTNLSLCVPKNKHKMLPSHPRIKMLFSNILHCILSCVVYCCDKIIGPRLTGSESE